MLAAVNALRLTAASAIAVLTAAAMFGSACFGPAIPDCGTPSPGETGTDGGLDPCHCDPPPSLNIQACPCLSGSPGAADEYNACMAIYRVEMMDAGAD
jgi:hypothetical protein